MLTNVVAIGTPVFAATQVSVANAVPRHGALEAQERFAPLAPEESARPAPVAVPAPDRQSTIDLVVVIDATASMGPYIAGAKETIRLIVARFQQQFPGARRLRIAIIAYRDHPPQDTTWVTRILSPTFNVDDVHTFLSNLNARGGGDAPEAVGAALGELAQLEWRTDAAKVAVIITDAPPHGIGEYGDGFPQGVPDSTDPFVAIETLAALGVRLYPVGCLPALNAFRGAAAFFIQAAERTGGKAVALTGAGRLGDVILGASVVEMGLHDLKEDAAQRVAAIAETHPEWSRQEVFTQVASDLDQSGVVYRSLSGAQLLADNTTDASLFEDVYSLVNARDKVSSYPFKEAMPAAGCGTDDDDDGFAYRSFHAVHYGASESLAAIDDDRPVYRSGLGDIAYGASGCDTAVYSGGPVYRGLGGGLSGGHGGDLQDNDVVPPCKRTAVAALDAPLVTESTVNADLLYALLGNTTP